jgi:hypothetical protein
MADWSTIASMSTAGGTLVLALATFSSVRSSQRSARLAEQTLLLGLRPVLAPSRLTDPPEKVMFGDRHMVKVEGGTAAVHSEGDAVYMVIPLRNVGAGLAVLHGWRTTAYPAAATGAPPAMARTHPDPESFRRLTRDLYVPAGDVGFWQGAVRDRDDPFREVAQQAAGTRSPMLVDLLYGDAEGGQRTISRFSLYPRESGEGWTCGVIRHWRLEGVDPRS